MALLRRQGSEPAAGVLAIRDLGPQVGLRLLGLAVAAVDLARALPLPAGQGSRPA
jgi:hypothetical protein